MADVKEYLWKGKDPKRNKTFKGKMEATDERPVEAYLKKRGIINYSIKEKPKDPFENIAFLQPKVETKDVIVWCRQFSTMIDAGLPIIQCLDILSSQAENPTFKKVLKDIKVSVESGNTLAESLKKYPDQFDELFANMVEAGETGGILDTILRRLSEHMEKAAKLKAQVKSAMMYPIITMCVAFIVVMVLLVFVIPVFQDMFAGLGGELPALTQVVVDMSEFAKKNFLFIGVGLAGFIITLKKVYKTEKGHIVIDDLMLSIPVMGMLIRKIAVAKFTRTMGTMLQSGVAILDALEIVAKTAGHKTVEATIYDVRAAISEGRTMADPLEESGVFPSMVCQMISVGEATGALDIMLEKIADFYDDEVDEAVTGMTEMIEPLMMVFLGGTIGTLVVAMYLPIFSMAGAV
ncbi:type II secretion system F family protein [Desulfonema magnum]|uniref:Type 4 fimbrial assembly protein n=1 Tax=Desulfonema magnum TaxID=45655 RepID=A0A975GSM9_9BACT|nr:type II secretion system F family protein [Desulfonema magnum]QTA92231.1 Type 4 fimbrial assembly protein [Desulfonema magnum]